MLDDDFFESLDLAFTLDDDFFELDDDFFELFELLDFNATLDDESSEGLTELSSSPHDANIMAIAKNKTGNKQALLCSKTVLILCNLIFF